jgi:hypothetical protein
VEIDELQLQQANVTIAYDTLSTNDIALDQLKAVWPDEPPQVLALTPQMLTAAYPPRNLRIEARERRLRIFCVQGQTWNPEDMAYATHAAVKAVKQGKIVAFGLNYLIGIKLALKEGRNSVQYLTSRYVSNTATLTRRGGGRLVGIGLQFVFKRKKGQFGINLNPVGPETLIADTNLHFERRDIPPVAELVSLLIEGREEVEARIGKL